MKKSLLALCFIMIFFFVFTDIGYASFSEMDKLAASDGAENDWFGASLAISGDIAIVGAHGDNDDGAESGSAYIFLLSDSSWVQQTKLTASDGAYDNYFGYSVDISGGIAVVGAPQDDYKGGNSGSAYIFQRSGNSWVQQTKLAASDGAENDWFGVSIAISGDTAIVGAYGDNDNGSNSGSAYIFQRSGSSWVQQTKLTASDGAGDDWFGYSIDISGDTAIVGASNDNDKGTDSGSAYIFQRSGSSWVQQAKLTASDGTEGDWFGNSVAISGDTAIVGARYGDVKRIEPGSAYIFQRSGSSWVQQTKLTASDGTDDDWFGRSVAIYEEVAIVGASQDNDNGIDSGSAYIFQRSDSSWVQQTKLTASDGAGDDWFGRSVAISGETSIVGAYGDDDNGDNSGAVYYYYNYTPLYLQIDSPSSSLFVSTGYPVSFTGSVYGGVIPYTYWWDFGGNGGSALEDPGPISFNTTGTHTIIFYVMDSVGEVVADSVDVTVEDTTPKIDTPTATTPIYAGIPVNFTGTVYGSASSYAYWWDFGGIGGSALEDPGYITFNSIGIYTINFYVQDSTGTVNTDSIDIYVTDLPSLFAQIDSPSSGTSINQGETLSFNGTASGGVPPYTYWWNFDNSAWDSTLEDPGSVTLDYQGAYTITFWVKDSIDSIASDYITMTVAISPVGPDDPSDGAP